MKLFFAYFFKGDLYNRFTELRRKQVSRKNRLFYAKQYLDTYDKFTPEFLDILYDILHLKPGKKAHDFILKLYVTNNISSLEKELPL